MVEFVFVRKLFFLYIFFFNFFCRMVQKSKVLEVRIKGFNELLDVVSFLKFC